MPSEALIDVTRVSKCFERGVRVLDDVTFSVPRGAMVALIGASGSGKSTLIRALAGLVAVEKVRDRNTQDGSGSIVLFGRPIQRDGRIVRGAKELRVRVGVIFQQFNLVPRLSVLTNVCLGFLGRMPFVRGTLSNFTMDEKRRAMYALTRVGMAEHALKRGSDLSGGQQQRAAIARTLVQGAELLIADRLARPRLGAPGDGHPRRYEPARRHHDPRLAASGSIRTVILPTHHRIAGGQDRV